MLWNSTVRVGVMLRFSVRLVSGYALVYLYYDPLSLSLTRDKQAGAWACGVINLNLTVA